MIVDSHFHLGAGAASPCVDGSLSAVLALMDSMHIDLAISAGHPLIFGRSDAGYRQAVTAYRESDGRILSCAYFNPYFPDDDLEWARHCLDHEAFVGVKIHPPLSECYGYDERWRPIWQLAAELEVPIVTHSWWVSDYNPRQRYATPDQFEGYVRDYPDVKLVLGHSGGRYEGHLAAAELARSYPNVYMDLSGDSYAYGLVEWLVGRAGAERILYGSDLTMIDGRTTMGRVLDADISCSAKARILGENAVQVFRLQR